MYCESVQPYHYPIHLCYSSLSFRLCVHNDVLSNLFHAKAFLKRDVASDEISDMLKKCCEWILSRRINFIY